MSYQRVIPRDLFNESKLLKCLGQLSLIIHDGLRVPRGLAIELLEPEDGFPVYQNTDDGSLSCPNVLLTCNGMAIDLRSRYNSKALYPLQYVIGDESGDVLNEDGKLTSDFVGALSLVEEASK